MSNGFFSPDVTPLCGYQNCSLSPYAGDGSVDIKGKPVLRHNTGNWRACPFILGISVLTNAFSLLYTGLKLFCD